VQTRIAIYIRSVKTARGAEQVSANVARGLADRGCRVDFLVEDAHGWVLDQLRDHHNIAVIELRAEREPLAHYWYLLRAGLTSLLVPRKPRLYRKLAWLRQMLRLIVKNDPPLHALCRYIDSARPVSIISYLNDPNMALMLAAMLRPGRTRYLVSVRNHISTAVARNPSKWLRSVPYLMRWLFPLADVVVAPSQGVAEDVVAITGLPAQRTCVIHNPVYRREIIEQSMQPLDHRWFADATVPVVVAAGKLKPQKDFATLLEAFARVRTQVPVRLVILGEGDERAALEQRAARLGIGEDIDMPGYVENPYNYFRRAAVFVLSSAWEGLPNVLIEAMACGCPVVATDCPSGPREILAGGRVGRLVPVADAGRMADAIRQTLAAPVPREVFVEQAKRYTYELAVEGYESVLVDGRCPG
jgi:glycosyltransferase involved in cell wall biosynthesis